MNVSVRSAKRVLILLEWLARQGGPVKLSLAASTLQLPKSSCLLLLNSLVEDGYCLRTDQGSYVLRRLPGEMVDGALDSVAVVHSVQSFVDDIAQTVEETSFWVKLTEQGSIRYLLKCLPRSREIQYDRNIAIERVAYRTSSGIAILSAIPAQEVDRYLNKVADLVRGDSDENGLEKLREEISQCQMNGFALVRHGALGIAAGIAAPVLVQGRCIGALNIAGPQERFLAALKAHESAVTLGAQGLSTLLEKRFTGL